MMTEDPKKRPVGDDEYYSANAKMSYYKDILNNALKGKNPKGFDQFISAVGEARRKNPMGVSEVVESYDFQDALTPQDLKAILKDDYSDYVETIRTIRDRGYADDKLRKLFGEKEMDQDVESLMYGKRFATIPLVLSRVQKGNVDGKEQVVEDMYTYDPKMKKVNKITVRK